MITTVNFHLTEACNYKCKFCFATFADIGKEEIKKKRLTPKEQKEVITLLANEGIFEKINFAGGEPTLLPHIQDLIRHAWAQGLETSIVTNGSRINAQWVAEIAPHLHILALSIDSTSQETNKKIGRHKRGEVLSSEKLIEIAEACHEHRVHLKVNTVVCKYNWQEVITDFINILRPFRWKVLQVTSVEGQNDRNIKEFRISQDEFMTFCEQNQRGLDKDIEFIPETEELIRSSYLMIDPLGRFYDNSQGHHSYSPPILEVGVKEALKSIRVDENKFIRRKGNYSVRSKSS